MHRWAGAGSWNYQARDTLQEAPLYRVLKLMRRGVMSEVMDTYLTTSLPHYLTTSRTPHLVELDLRGQIAAAYYVANERLDLLFRKYGTGTVGDVMADMLAYAGFLLCKKTFRDAGRRVACGGLSLPQRHRDAIYAIKARLRGAERVGPLSRLRQSGHHWAQDRCHRLRLDPSARPRRLADLDLGPYLLFDRPPESDDGGTPLAMGKSNRREECVQCQRKWLDQPLDHRSGKPRCR
jgi:hypothetical protein